MVTGGAVIHATSDAGRTWHDVHPKLKFNAHGANQLDFFLRVRRTQLIFRDTVSIQPSAEAVAIKDRDGNPLTPPPSQLTSATSDTAPSI